MFKTALTKIEYLKYMFLTPSSSKCFQRIPEASDLSSIVVSKIIQKFKNSELNKHNFKNFLAKNKNIFEDFPGQKRGFKPNFKFLYA